VVISPPRLSLLDSFITKILLLSFSKINLFLLLIVKSFSLYKYENLLSSCTPSESFDGVIQTGDPCSINNICPLPPTGNEVKPISSPIIKSSGLVVNPVTLLGSVKFICV